MSSQDDPPVCRVDHPLGEEKERPGWPRALRVRRQFDGSSHDQGQSGNSLTTGGLKFCFENRWAVAYIAALVVEFVVYSNRMCRIRHPALLLSRDCAAVV